jgi:hypothetical protein
MRFIWIRPSWEKRLGSYRRSKVPNPKGRIEGSGGGLSKRGKATMAMINSAWDGV